LSTELAQATTPEQVLDFERRIAAYEAYMRAAGFDQGDLHEVNEHRMRARWRLGQMLAAVERQKGGKGVRAAHGLLETLKRLKLERSRAIEAQRLGTMPKVELEKRFRELRESGEFATIAWLIGQAQPFWHKEQRRQRHAAINAKAAARANGFGPFPLIYADPPWHFKTYSQAGGGRSPDQHYPTLPDDEIVNFKIDGRPIRAIAHDDAMLFLWCTSSNLQLALHVMNAWGFEFKSSAVWIKEAESGRLQVGMGQIFRNAHELLLYGSRGNAAGPLEVPLSVFRYPRTRHSAKPPEIRAAIERMYPDFADNRIELFARGPVPGWVTDGFEA
jgi:N6-adenosine-specific RNA methylase IME4